MSCCAATLTSSEYLKEIPARYERLERERIVSESVNLGSNRYKTDFVVPAMHCAACIRKIENSLSSLKNVEEVRANLSLKTVSIIWNEENGGPTVFSNALESLGFENHISSPQSKADKDDSESRTLLMAMAVAGFSAANIMLLSVSVWSGADAETARLFHLISGLIAVPTVWFSGRPFFKSAFGALSVGRLNMDVPISLAVLLALGMSIYESLAGGEEAYFDASVTLLFFLLIGRYLDQLMRHKARNAAERLHSLTAKDGVLIDENGEINHIPLNQIRPGMKLRVFAGERIPVNARIATGDTDIDRSHVSGESAPVHVVSGDVIEAGALNLSGNIDIVAESDAQHSFLGEMREMLEVAERGRGDYLRVADRMAQIYAPAVHGLALVTFVGWMFATSGDWQQSLYTAIAVLIITCPCALGLAVPVAHVIGANKLMKNGILMRDGTALERLAEVDKVVFDKTGTVTTATPKVSDCLCDDAELYPLICALAMRSHHPSSVAIAAFLSAHNHVELDECREIPGAGVEGLFQNKLVRLGKPEWVSEISSGQEKIEANWSVAFAIKGGAVAGFIIEESIREGTVETIEKLKQAGFTPELCSGDIEDKVRFVAGQIGVKLWKSSQKPADKIENLKNLEADGKKAMMVGDGINDAPALASGHVSMVPASASDIGRHAADFVFIRNSLTAVTLALDTAKFTSSVVRQNFGLAIAYNCIAVPLAMAGYVTPLFAALAMSLSSIVVVLNSFRIGLERNSKEENSQPSVNSQQLSMTGAPS